MRKLLKLFSFWFFIISILIIIVNISGEDDYNLLLIGLNPILYSIVYEEPFRSIIWDDGPNLYMYIAHLFTLILYGGIIDLIIITTKRLINRTRKVR